MKLNYASVLDYDVTRYPRKVAGVVFLSGCPLECGWCNTPLLLKRESAGEESTDFFLEHFRKSREFIDAVVFTGGEPLMQGNALFELCQRLKAQGFLIKIETSGYYPDALVELLPYVDYVAMDVKTRLEKDAYAKACNFKGDKELLLSNVLRSLAFLETKGKSVFKELRTTILPGLNDSIEVVRDICSQIRFADLYALQAFEPSHDLVDFGFKQTPAPSRELLYGLAEVAKQFGVEVAIRYNGVEEKV